MHVQCFTGNVTQQAVDATPATIHSVTEPWLCHGVDFHEFFMPLQQEKDIPILEFTYVYYVEVPDSNQVQNKFVLYYVENN